MNVRNHVGHAIAAALFTATLTGFAPAGLAVGNAASNAFKRREGKRLRVAGHGAAREELRAVGKVPPHPPVPVLRRTGPALRELGLASLPGEAEGDFRARIAHALHERRDEQVDRLRDKSAARIRALDEQVRRAGERVEREQAQYSQRKLDTIVSVGSSVLGAIFGGRSGAASKAGTAARSAGRVMSEKGDVDRAGESLL